MILAESDVVTLVISTTTLQGHFATTDEAVEKLARAVKSSVGKTKRKMIDDLYILMHDE